MYVYLVIGYDQYYPSANNVIRGYKNREEAYKFLNLLERIRNEDLELEDYGITEDELSYEKQNYEVVKQKLYDVK